MEADRKNHWEIVYLTKQPHEVSWTQEVPRASLDFIHSFGLPKTARIIDVGGGDSNLVDHLLAEGYENVSVLDISATALERAKRRLGEKATKVTWIVGDIVDFEPKTTYDAWHDRATFHFLTKPAQVMAYVQNALKCVSGYLAIGTFSEEGPDKCSGLEIKQYSEAEMEQLFSPGFRKTRCVSEDHPTPFGTLQNFLFCGFERKQSP